MDIHIALSHAEVECFRGQLPAGTDLSRKFDEWALNYLHSTKPHGGYSNIIECDEGEARALLRIAIESALTREKGSVIFHHMNSEKR